MRKYMMAVLTIALLMAFVASGPANAYDESSPMVLKAGIANPEGDIMARTIKKFGDLVTEKSNGRIKFQYFYGSSLIKKPQFVDAVARGIADVSTGPASFISGKIRDLSIFEIGGIFDLKKFMEMQSAIAPYLTEIMGEKGIHYVMTQYNGPEVWAHRKKFLKTPGDWKGQKMRVGGPWKAKLAVASGGSTVFMPPSDLYLALQRGVIDGFGLVYDVINGLKLYETAPYIINCNFNNTIEMVVMNKKKWEQMTPEDRKMVDMAAREAMEWNYKESQAFYVDLEKKLIEKGAKIYTLTPEEQAAFYADAKKLIPQIREVSSPTGNKMIDELMNYSLK